MVFLNTNFVKSDFSSSLLNQNFTKEEMSKVLKTWKGGKSAGSDCIINEVIIHTYYKLKGAEQSLVINLILTTT